MSFINPLFLIGLSAALLPIIYHLIRKMRAKKIKFSSLIFLKATPKELIKKRRLRDLVLLIVRSLILGLLAFAFARPFIPEENIPFVSGIVNKSVVLLIDNSYSMQYEDQFERAVSEANGILDDADPADEFAIIVFSDEARVLTELSGDITTHRDILNTMVTVSNRPTDYYNPITRAEEILKDAQYQKREIILISDLQNYGWSNRFDNWNLDKNLNFVPIQISADDPVNTYVEQFNQKISRSGENVASEYNIHIAFQKKDFNRDYELGLLVNGKEVDKKNIETTRSDKVIFQQLDIKQGEYQGYVFLEDDRLNIDNRYYFSYVVEERPSILCIDESSLSFLNSAFYLEKAFNMGEKSDYTFDGGARDNLTRARLMDRQIVFLANIVSLTQQQVDNLKRYVEDGGTVVISFGERLNISRFSNNLVDLGIGSASQVIELSLREIAILSEYDQRHPIFSVFARTGQGDLYRPKFEKYVKIIPDTSANVLATFSTEDPLLVERKLGGGKFLVFTSTFDQSWTDFPINEIFLPFVYQIVKYAVSGTKRTANYLVGDPVTLKGKTGEEWEISAPGNKIFKVTLDETGTGYFRDTDIPGNYRAVYGTERRYFSVNVDMRESKLEMRDVDEVYAAVTRPSEEVEEEIKKAASAALEIEEKRQKFWTYIILFVLLLVLFETFYANKQLNLKT